MANGRVFHQAIPSAASRDYPIGSVIRVTCLSTGSTIDVEVTDRGPWGTRYQLDLSKAAFKALGVDLSKGWAWVTASPVAGVGEEPPKFSDEIF